MNNLLEIKAEAVVKEYGNRCFQEGLYEGLQTAISILQSVDNEDAANSCLKIIHLAVEKAKLPTEYRMALGLRASK